MQEVRVLSVRKTEFPRPSIVRLETHPIRLSEVISHEILPQYLRSLRVVRKRADKLLEDYLNKSISEYDIKREYLRIYYQLENIINLIQVGFDVETIIDEMKYRIFFIEKILEIISENDELDNFDKYFFETILMTSSLKLINYRKSLNKIRLFLEEHLKDVTCSLKLQRKFLKTRINHNVSRQLKLVLESYERYSGALHELYAIQLTLNIGLTKLYSDLLNYFRRKNEIEITLMKYRAGDVSRDEYERVVEAFNKTADNVRLKAQKTLNEFNVFTKKFYENKQRLYSMFSMKLVDELEKLIQKSEINAKIIKEILFS